MKTSFIKGFSLLLFGALALFSCEKEQVQPTATNNTPTTVELRNEDCDCDALLASIESDGEMLYFPDGEVLLQAEKCLNERVDAYVDAFVSEHGEMEDEAFNDLADELGFEENEPLRLQEQEWGINSLRGTIDAAIDQWLDESGEDLNTANFPDDYYIKSDALRTMINSNAQINISGQTMDYSALRRSGNDDNEDDGECKANVHKCDPFIINNSQNRMIVDACTYDAVFFQKATVKVHAYEWIRNKWRKRRTMITAEIGGQFRDIHCNNLYEVVSDTETKRRRSLCASDSFSRIGHPQGRILQGVCQIESAGTIAGHQRRVCL